MVSVQQINSLRATTEHFQNDAMFYSVVHLTHMGPPRNAYFPLVVQRPNYHKYSKKLQTF